MLQSWNGAYESKELHKMEERKEKETKGKMKLSTIRNMSTDHKAQKESYASRSVDILFLLYFVFALKMSVAG